MKKFFRISLIIVLCLIVLAGTAFADSPTNIKSFLNQETEAAPEVAKSLNAVYSVIQVIGITVGTVMLIVLGIKYMVSSVSERAEIKKHAYVYILGAILFYGGSGIVSIIRQFATKAIK